KIKESFVSFAQLPHKSVDDGTELMLKGKKSFLHTVHLMSDLLFFTIASDLAAVFRDDYVFNKFCYM
ncbi:MAG: hypothetical protein KAJ10_10740, partial [Thermodesulfovibrionia bacterium]|nr:hypothetical protein [Thermodesulfovibrionia bacterium]